MIEVCPSYRPTIKVFPNGLDLYFTPKYHSVWRNQKDMSYRSITRLMKTLVARWAHLATPWSILMLMLQRICLYFTFMIMRTFIRMRGIQTQVSGMACLDLWVLNLQSADHVRCSLLLVLAAGWGQEVAIYVRFLSFSPLLVVVS